MDESDAEAPTDHSADDKDKEASVKSESDVQDVIPPKVNIDTYRETVDRIPDEPEAALDNEHKQHTDDYQRKHIGKCTKNYALDSCGAKIEKASPDVTSPKYVLSNNPDQYARAPCDKKFSFTVELCEKIQLHRIAVSVNELFASKPSEFVVHAADQQKSLWEKIGEFKLSSTKPSNGANILAQSFEVDENVSHRFVKFLKYEMLTHQGDETLCVLSSFQAYGFGEHIVNEDIDDGSSEGSDASDHPDTPIQKIVQTIKTISNVISGSGTASNDPTPKDPGGVIVSRQLGIRSYKTCWFASVINRECDIGCDDFMDAMFFKYCPGPVIAPAKVPDIVPKPAENVTKIHNNQTKSEEAPKVEKPVNDPTTEHVKPVIETQNKTKTDVSQKKENADPNQPVLLKQINRLEKNLTWMGSYLETLSHTYKKQMDDVRTSFERTQNRLSKVESESANFKEKIEQLVDMIRHLYLEVNRLDTTLEKIILAASLVIGLQILLILLHCRPARDRCLHQRLAQIEVTLELLKDRTDAINASAKHAQEQDAKPRRYSDVSNTTRANSLKSRQTKKSKSKVNLNRIDAVQRDDVFDIKET